MNPDTISSATYPIVGRWLAIQAIYTPFVSLLVLVLVFGGLVFSENGGTPLATTLHWSSTTVIWLAIGIYIAALVLVFLVEIIWRATFSFELDTDFIVLRSGIISRSEKHVPYRTVQDVVVSQSFLERIFGLAHVIVQNAAQGGMNGAGNITIPGQPLAKANELSAAVRQIVLTKNSTHTGL